MKKISLFILLLVNYQSQGTLPPGSCADDQVQVTAAGLMGGQCVNKKNLEDTLFYLNDTLKLKVTDRELVRACNEFKRDNLEAAFSYLHLDCVNSLPENKLKVLKAACIALENGFLAPGPKECIAVSFPNGDKNNPVKTTRPNGRCQKFDLNGHCLEYGECPVY